MQNLHKVEPHTKIISLLFPESHIKRTDVLVTLLHDSFNNIHVQIIREQDSLLLFSVCIFFKCLDIHNVLS